MADIRTFLEKIKNAVYGREVRQAIHDGIRCCYDDGKAGSIDLQAREDIAILKDMVEYGVLQSGGDWFCQDFSEVNRAILSEVGTMRINSVKHVSMQLDIPDTVLCSAGRMSIYYGMHYGPQLCAHAEIVTMDGYRLHTTGYAPEGGTLAGMVFDEWEWENPPMLYTEEYRTTERYAGAPVYVRQVDFWGGDSFVELGSMVTRNFKVDVKDASSCPVIVSVTGTYDRFTYSNDDIRNCSGTPCHGLVDIGAQGFRDPFDGECYLGVTATPLDEGLLSSGKRVVVVVKYTK